MRTYIPINKHRKWIILGIALATLIVIISTVVLVNKNNVLNLGKVEKVQKSAYSQNVLKAKDLKEGDYIKYDTGISTIGDNGVITCVVLYDSTSEYGVQIIPISILGTISLGDSQNFNNAVNSYNNAISKLNTQARKYLNTKYAISARCVGSVPNNPNYETKTYHKVRYEYAKHLDGILKDEDSNYRLDLAQLEKLGIKSIGESYWLASRKVRAGANLTGFAIRNVYYTGSIVENYDLCGMYSEITIDGNIKYYHEHNLGLRPIFTLRSDLVLLSGNGTQEEPYNLEQEGQIPDEPENKTYDVTLKDYETGTQNGLAGATIGIYDNEGNLMTDQNGNPVKLTTDENGDATLKVSPGTYYYKQTKAPDGYALNNETYSFTVGEDGSITFANDTKGIIYNEPIGGENQGGGSQGGGSQGGENQGGENQGGGSQGGGSQGGGSQGGGNQGGGSQSGGSQGGGSQGGGSQGGGSQGGGNQGGGSTTDKVTSIPTSSTTSTTITNTPQNTKPSNTKLPKTGDGAELIIIIGIVVVIAGICFKIKMKKIEY